LAFQSFDFERHLTKVILSVPDEGYSERTWRRLFWAYLMKVILSVPDEGYSLSVPDEGYSERTWRRLFWAYLMKVILSVPDEGYSERTWWRLFQKHVVCTTFYIYVFILRTSLNNFDMLSQHCEIPSGIVEIFRWFFFSILWRVECT
jgi:hypothetical protein